ncbi:MAG: tetratricopeptide repeat protein [Gammaproteobacteria bacterium]
MLSIAFVIELSMHWRDVRVNRGIDTLMAGHDAPVPKDPAPEILLARGARWVRAGEEDQAISIYNLLSADRRVDGRLRVSAYYNLGNVYLRRGMAQAQAMKVDRARTAIQIAKEIYRDALRIDPRHWDARYNLETAGYVVPDLPLGDADPDEDGPHSKDAWSDMQGFPSGLP